MFLGKGARGITSKEVVFSSKIGNKVPKRVVFSRNIILRGIVFSYK